MAVKGLTPSPKLHNRWGLTIQLLIRVFCKNSYSARQYIYVMKTCLVHSWINRLLYQVSGHYCHYEIYYCCSMACKKCFINGPIGAILAYWCWSTRATHTLRKAICGTLHSGEQTSFCNWQWPLYYDLFWRGSSKFYDTLVTAFCERNGGGSSQHCETLWRLRVSIHHLI